MENRSKTLLTPQQQISSFNYSYSEQQPKPCAHFWKELTKTKHTPSLLIPDTLILNLKQQPLLWVYTNRQGKVQANSNISFKDFIHKLTSYCSPNELVVTIKRLVSKNQSNNYGNDVKLVNSRYLHNLTLQQFGDQVITIQRYVKSHGKYAFICRTVYSKDGCAHCYVITNKFGYYDDSVGESQRFLVTNGQSVRNSHKYAITKTARGRYLVQTLPLLMEMVNYMRFQRGIVLTDLVGDFIRDEEGNWWLTNIKAFKVQHKLKYAPSSPNLLIDKLDKPTGPLGDKQKYQRTKQCRYCQISYLQSQLTHKLTKKMLIQMDRYLLHLGKNYQWLARSDASTDSHSLYQEQTVCSRCYRLYLEIQALLSFQGKFLKKLNLGTQGNAKDLLMRLTGRDQLQAQAKGKEIMNLKTTIPPEISLGPNSSIITHNDRPLRNDQYIHEMTRYRFIIYLHELDELVGVAPNTNYHLEFSLFGAKFRTKLDVRPGVTSTLIKKLRLCYFFFPAASEIKNLQEYMNRQQILKLQLVAETRSGGERRMVGKLCLDLKQFLVNGRKSFYKFLDTQYGFGWGLEGSIGLVRTQKEVNTSRLILTNQDRLVYLPNQQYFICEPLPQDWMTQIQNKNKQKTNQNLMKTNEGLRMGMDTNQQFIPDRTFQKQEKKVKKIDWKNQLNKELKSYQRKAFKPIQ